jgi:endonuclease/exonuclease/phosphatase family metal-dependent hydrolase
MLLLVYISVYINPARFSLIAFAGLSYPVILLVNLIFVLLWIFIRIKFSLLSLIVILLGWNHIGRLVQVNQKDEIDKDKKTIKILSYNIQNFVKQNVSNTKYITSFNNQVKITKFINDQKADIVCLQEILYDRGEVQRFAAEFGQRNKTPNYYYRNYFQTKTGKLDGIAIFTRYPVVKKGFLEYQDKTIGIYNDIIIRSDTFRVYNLHLASIHFKKEEYDFISDLPNQQDQEVIKKHSFQVISKLRTAFINRGHQVNIVQKHIEKSPFPVILCGDFNDTPSSYAYRRLTSQLNDAFVESGKGFGVTYAGESFPSFRIDYIFHDDVFESRRFTRHKNTLSDHYPISCTLVMKDE